MSLERTELPTALREDKYSSATQLLQVEELKALITKITSSVQFKHLESGQTLESLQMKPDLETSTQEVLAKKLAQLNPKIS